VLIVRMFANLTQPATISGPTTSTPGDGYTYYTFTGSGYITF
jgi:hypothetical protein